MQKLSDLMPDILKSNKQTRLTDLQYKRWCESIPDECAFPVWRYGLVEGEDGWTLEKVKRSVVWSKEKGHFVYFDARNNTLDPWDVNRYVPSHKCAVIDEDNDTMAFAIIAGYIVKKEREALDIFEKYEAMYKPVANLVKEN